MILLFMHGWGFDAGFWSGLAGLLAEWPAECDDRGYFGASRHPRPAGPCLVVAHSFGVMRALCAPPAGCRGLVAINGFDRFTSDGDSPGVSPRIIERMIEKFDAEPDPVLADFRRRCGAPAATGPKDIARLRQDLLALRDMDCRERSAGWPVPILSVQSGRDPLLPAPMREHAFAGAPLVQRLTHPTGGHLLPASDAPYCARAIRAFMEQLP